jgi:hypothetical protein
MQKLKAKFKCQSVTSFQGDQQQVQLMAITGTSEENKSYSLYTPVGNLSMNITNPAALGFFVPGTDYVLDITPAE